MTAKKLTLAEAEAELIATFSARSVKPTTVFLLGSPRTGSTLIYQAFATAFSLPYIANITNDCFAEYPVLGLSLQKSLPAEISYKSSFGKTSGTMQPSEASAVMMRWFGGGHPSQTVSPGILEGQEQNFCASLAAIEALYGRPLMIKNAWHCFRVPYLASALPEARFVWIRRDVAVAAKSDLEARYVTKSDANSWNSATPANYKQLLLRPPTEQVVENQYEFNFAMRTALAAGAAGRYAEIWYEDFVAAPERTLERTGAAIGLSPDLSALRFSPERPQKRRLSDAEDREIDTYLARNKERYAFMRYGEPKSLTQ